jgi:two-component system cell cycle response regulator
MMSGQPLRVLLIEDTFSNAKMLEAKLVQGGFSVELAFDGFEALAKLGVYDFDVVLLDVMMPGMDGFETCRRIKRDGRTARLPVIMLTALDSPTDRELGFDAGADDFFVKPVEDGRLFPRMVELVRGESATPVIAAQDLAGAG